MHERFILQLAWNFPSRASSIPTKPLRPPPTPFNMSQAHPVPLCHVLTPPLHWLLTWLLWMDIAQASWRGSCCRLRSWPPVACTVQRSARMTSVTPHRNRTWGSPEGGVKSHLSAQLQGSEVRTSSPSRASLFLFTLTRAPAATPASRTAPRSLTSPLGLEPDYHPSGAIHQAPRHCQVLHQHHLQGEGSWRCGGQCIPMPGLSSRVTAAVLGGWGMSRRCAESAGTPAASCFISPDLSFPLCQRGMTFAQFAQKEGVKNNKVTDIAGL